MAIRVSSSGKAGIVILLFFVLGWNGIWVAALIKDHAHLINGGAKSLLFLLFPLIGLGFLVFVIRTIGSALLHGDTLFEAEEDINSFTLGAPLRGTIRFLRPQPATMGHSFRLTLSCTEDRGTGKDRSTQTIWQDHHVAEATADGTIPVSFCLPGDEEIMSGYGQSTPNIAWQIAVAETEKSFFAFSSTYRVPLAPRELTVKEQSVTETARIAHRKEVAAYQHPATSRIVVRPTGLEATEFYFPAGMNAKMLPLLVLFMLAFGGVAVFLSRRDDTPILIPYFFGLPAVICLYALLQVLCGTMRTVAGPEGLSVIRSLLGWSRTRRIATSDITAMKTAVLMTSGGKPYHTIQAVCGEKKISVSPNLADLLEAEALAAQMGKCVGLGES